MVDIEQSKDIIHDDLDLLEIVRSLLNEWKIIGFFVVLCILLGGAYAFTTPNIYRAEVILVPSQQLNVSNKTSGLLSSLGSAGSLLGLNGGGDVSDIDKHIAILKSKTLLYDFFTQNQLLPILFADDWDSKTKKWIEEDDPITLYKGYEYFVEDILKLDKDINTGIVTLQIYWTDPKLAKQWANELVKKLNEYSTIQATNKSKKLISYLEGELTKVNVRERRDLLFNLIEQEIQNLMLATSDEEYAFKIIDKAVIPEKKVRPKRAFILIGSALGGGFFGIIFVLFRGPKKIEI